MSTLRAVRTLPHSEPGTSHPAPHHARRIPHYYALLFLLVAVATATACHPGPPGPLEGKASDEWTRSYTLDDGGEVQLVGGNGAIEVRGGSGKTVDVAATRSVRAYDDKMAQDVLPRVEIREDVGPAKIVLTTEGLGGLVIGVEVSVSYRVTVPAGTKLRLRTANGAILVADVEGRVVANSANGKITVQNLKGGVEARSANGDLAIDVARFGDDPVDLRTSNGKIDLTIPADTNASLIANVANGAVDVTELAFEPTGEQTRRRVRGRVNSGGLPIELTTTNGSIRIHPRP